MDTDRDYQMYSQQQGEKPYQHLSQNQAAGGEEGSGQTLDLAWLFSVIRRRAAVMAASAIALSALAGSVIIWQAKKTPPSYQGSFRVLVEPVTAEGRLAKLSLLAQSGTSTGASEISKLGVDSSDLAD